MWILNSFYCTLLSSLPAPQQNIYLHIDIAQSFSLKIELMVVPHRLNTWWQHSSSLLAHEWTQPVFNPIPFLGQKAHKDTCNFQETQKHDFNLHLLATQNSVQNKMYLFLTGNHFLSHLVPLLLRSNSISLTYIGWPYTSLIGASILRLFIYVLHCVCFCSNLAVNTSRL